MPKVSLTDLVLQNLKAPLGGRTEYWDASLPSFGVRVTKNGTKTFVVLIHRNRKAVGRYPAMSLKQARSEAKRLLFSGQAEAASSVPAIRYPDAVERYLDIKREELRASTIRDYERILRRFTFSTTVDEIRPFHVADALDGIKGQQDKCTSFAVLKGFLGWCWQREYCPSNPMQNLKKPKVPLARDRVLDDDELVAIWQASKELGKFGAIVRLVILTGQRREQIASLQTNWVHDDHIVFPPTIMKNKREHWCPIGSLVKFTLLEVIPVDQYYFSPVTAVGRSFSAWSKNKKKLDALVQLEPWQLRDLRRTWATNASRLDVPPHVTSRVLSHTSPEGGLMNVYNRHKYRREMSEAMQKMNEHILSLIADDPTSSGSTWTYVHG